MASSAWSLAKKVPLAGKISNKFSRPKDDDPEPNSSDQLAIVPAGQANNTQRAFKPAPPVTTLPPPKRDYQPIAVTRPVNKGSKQLFSESRSISSKQLIKPLPPRRRSEQMDGWQNQGTRSGTDMSSSEQAIRPPIFDQEKPPALPSRTTSAPVTLATPSTVPALIVEEKPVMPPRRISVPVPVPSAAVSNELVLFEQPPSLPARTYSIPTPVVPERNYRQQSGPTISAPAVFKPPKKPQHLMAKSTPVQVVSEEVESDLSRVVSASSVRSARSSASVPSFVSSRSTISSISPATPKSPHIAELIKALELKKAVQPPVAGSIRVPGMA